MGAVIKFITNYNINNYLQVNIMYQIERFIKIIDGHSPIGEGDVYDWRNVESGFNKFDDALSRANQLAKESFITDYRISDGSENWSV